ncbi:MAG TPA: O-antigen ligase family protein [Candidatus Saccharimonadales bacterium]|nr:O-antigen ligase family protein [Candidatus Saccharimonadales bacterium]
MIDLRALFRIFTKRSPSELFLLSSWLVILALMPFHAFLSTWGGASIGPLEVWKSWKEILLLIDLVVSLIYLYRSRKLQAYWADKLVWLIFAYAALHLVLWAVFRPERSPALAGILMNLRFLGMVLLTWVLLTFVPRRKLLDLGLVTVAVGGLAVLLFAVLQATLLPTDFLQHFGYGNATIAPATTLDNNQSIVRLQSTLRGPNPLAEYLIIIGVVFATAWRKDRRLLMSGLLLLTGVVLFFTYSRSAWLGAFVAGAVFIFVRIKSQRLRRVLVGGTVTVFMVGGIGLAVALPHSVFLQNTILHNKTGDHDRGSTVEHFAALGRAGKNMWHHPFGQGPGTAGPASFYGPTPNIPENYYLQIAEELGIFGLLLFLAINGMVAWRLWQQRQHKWAGAWLAAFVGLAVVNFFLQGWADETTAIIWWSIAAILYRVEK